MKSDEKKFERARLMDAMERLGFPPEFGTTIADELGGPWSMRRMTGYLNAAQPKRFEEIADELATILEQRQHLVEKFETEAANARWNEFLNRNNSEFET